MILTIGAADLVATCVGAVAPGGRVVLFAGFGAAPHATLDLDVIHYREVSLVGSEWIGTPPNQRRERYADALGLITSGEVPVERLVSGEVATRRHRGCVRRGARAAGPQVRASSLAAHVSAEAMSAWRS